MNGPPYQKNTYQNPIVQNQMPPVAYPQQSDQYYQPYGANPQYAINPHVNNIPFSNYENEIVMSNIPPNVNPQPQYIINTQVNNFPYSNYENKMAINNKPPMSNSRFEDINNPEMINDIPYHRDKDITKNINPNSYTQPRNIINPQVNNIPRSKFKEKNIDNNPLSESNNITPMLSQDSGIYANAFSYSTGNYCFDKIFLSYFFLSIIYLPMNIAVNYIYLSENVLGWVTLLLIILGVIFFKSVKKYAESYDTQYTILIFIFLLIFKMVFFFVICYAEYYTNFKEDSQSYFYVSQIDYTYLHVPHFFFESAGAALFYLFLIIYSKIQPEVNLVVIGFLGLIASVATFLPLFFNFDQTLGNIVVGLMVIEVGALIFSIYMSKKKELLISGDTANNIIIIDYYKFLLLMCVFLLIFMFYLLILYCVCSIIYNCLNRVPTSVDSDGNIYDQCGSKMSINLPRKAYSYKNGKFYDILGKEIEPSACRIF